MIDLSDKSLAELKNLVANYSAKGRANDAIALQAREELARRQYKGLNFERSMEVIKAAARERRFLTYKGLAEASQVEFQTVRYLVNGLLGDLITYAHHKGWPLLSAIVVNQQHEKTGGMDEQTLKGFVTAAESLGIDVPADHNAFLRDQQEKVFAWAGAVP